MIAEVINGAVVEKRETFAEWYARKHGGAYRRAHRDYFCDASSIGGLPCLAKISKGQTYFDTGAMQLLSIGSKRKKFCVACSKKPTGGNQ